MITVNGLTIDNQVQFIVEEVHYKVHPNRDIKMTGVSRRSKSKITGSEWTSKDINIKGVVFGTTASGLLTLVDTLQQNFSVQSLALSIDAGRTYTATLSSLDIPTQFYNLTYVRYDATFLAADPFSYASQITASGTVVSGTITYSGALTISGTVYNEPILTLNPKGAAAGNTGIVNYMVTHVPTGETMTVSGTINYTSPLNIDYKNYLVTNSGVSSDYSGIFSRFEPGVVNYTITTSGIHNGYNYSWAYAPRYFQ